MTAVVDAGFERSRPERSYITPEDYYAQRLEAAEGDLEIAVQEIETHGEAMSFALGMAQDLMRTGKYNENGSAAAASANVIIALAKASGPRTPDYDSKDYSSRLELWGRNLDILKRAQDTPGMWRCLMQGLDFEPVSQHNGIPYSPRHFKMAQDTLRLAGLERERFAARFSQAA